MQGVGGTDKLHKPVTGPGSPAVPHPAGPLAVWMAGDKPGAIARAEAVLAGGAAPPWQRAESLMIRSFQADGRDDYEAAVAFAEQAAALAPGHMLVQVRLSSLLRRTGSWQRGLALAEQMVRQWPRQILPRLELAQVLTEAERFEDAKLQYLLAVRLDPDHAAAHVGFAEMLMITGDMIPGWQEYSWRFRMPATKDKLPKLKIPVWNGMRWSRGRLLLIADQGYGDCLQYVRFVPWAASRVGEVVIAANPKLAPLFARIPGVTRVIERWEDLPQSDFRATLSDLPCLYGATLENLPAEVPYFPLDEGRVAAWRQRLEGIAGEELKVGLSWSGRTDHLHNRLRSLPLKGLAPLADVPGVRFFSLQFDKEKRQLGDWPGRPLVDLSPELEGFEKTAECYQALDLVITIDTSSAHLAGGLGRPTWTLLRRVPDWRWLLERPDSPWYPTMRLFRQGEDRTWGPVVAEVRAELARVAAGERDRLLPPTAAARP